MFEKFFRKLTNEQKGMTNSNNRPMEISAADKEQDPADAIVPKLNLDLAQFLIGLNIKCIDIGARGEGLSSLKIIAPFVDYYACEPESKANLDLLNGSESQIWRSYTVLKEAIGTGKHRDVLHITRQPGLSSLL